MEQEIISMYQELQKIGIKSQINRINSMIVLCNIVNKLPKAEIKIKKKTRMIVTVDSLQSANDFHQNNEQNSLELAHL